MGNKNRKIRIRYLYQVHVCQFSSLKHDVFTPRIFRAGRALGLVGVVPGVTSTGILCRKLGQRVYTASVSEVKGRQARQATQARKARKARKASTASKASKASKVSKASKASTARKSSTASKASKASKRGEAECVMAGWINTPQRTHTDTPHLLVVQSEYYGTIPGYQGTSYVARSGLGLCPLPIPIGPRVGTRTIHDKLHNPI